ncbi:MAG: Tetratricopeptide TPR_2 repeat protein, partial [Chloroflexi bacterium OLB15]
MSEISLREYLADLDRLLNQHAADDVILHSRHILQYYPKIVDAYRYLGRALILNGRWDEAEAALRRVIAVVPDDYYAHTGLSEIYDRNRRGDEAIWHLERALEQNPNQRELIDSLRSLYKRYRNIDQAKVPMTAGGVARQAMANQSYEQAIETLRSALVRHKDRVDLRLLLAESLWAGSDPVEAAESAMDVLEVLPDCLSANAIMTRLWLHEGRSSDAQRYLNRVEAVAPYLAVEIATNQPVDDNAFRIEKLDVKRSAQAELSLNRPDWLQDISPEAAAAQATADEWSSWSAGESGLLAAAGIAAKPENTPSTDWSSDAQTLEQPIPSLFDLDENTDSLVANVTDSEMPEWMNAPTMQVPLSAVQAAQDAQEDDALAWLQSNDSPSLADDEMPPDELLFGLHEDTASPAPIEEEALDWLKGFDEDGDTGATPTAEIPDWMMDDPLPARNIPEPDFATSSPVEPAQNFDWAANDQFLDEALGIESLAGNESAPIAEPTIEDLDWLAGAAAFEQASEQAADDSLIEAGLTGIPDEPDSYDPFAAAASAAPKASEEMIAEDDAWLDQVSNEPAGVPGPKRGLTAMLKDANFDWMNEETSTELPSAIDQTMDDWTRQFDPAPAQTSNDNPDWLQAIESGDDTAVMRVPSAAAPAEDVPSVQEDAPTEVLDAAALTAAEAAPAGDDFDWANVEAASEDQAADSNAYPALDMLLGVSAATGAADAAVEAFDNNAASAEAEPISESDLDWLGEVGVTVEKPANEAISASEDDLAALFGAETETQPEIETDMELDWLNEVDPALADQLAAEPAADREDDLEALFAVSE